MAYVVAALGGVMLAAHYAGWADVYAPWPGIPAVRAVAAVSLILLGIASARAPNRKASLLQRLCAATALFIALWRLVEITQGAEILPELQRLLTPPDDVDRPAMGLGATLAIAALGLSPLLHYTHHYLAAQIMIVAAWSLALMSVLGYALGLTAFHGQMAPATTAGFVVLAFAGSVQSGVRPPARCLFERTPDAIYWRVPIIATVIAFFAASALLAMYTDVPAEIIPAATACAIAWHVSIMLVACDFYHRATRRRRRQDVRLEDSLARLRASDLRFSGIMNSAQDGVIFLDGGQRVTMLNTAAEKMFGITSADIVGQPILRLMPERFRAGHPAHVARYRSTGQTARRMGSLGVVHGLRADGTEFPIEASISQADTDGTVSYAVLLRDVTEKMRAEAQMRDKVRKEAALANFSVSAARAEDLPAIRQKAVEQVCATLDAEFGTIMEIDESHQVVRFMAGVGWSRDGGEFKFADMAPDSFSHYVVTHPGAIRFTDQGRDPRFAASQVLSDHGIHGGAVVSVMEKDRPSIILCVFTRAARAFSDDDIQFLQTVASALAVLRSRAIIQDSLRRANQALEAITVGVAISDETTDPTPIVYANPAFARMHGRSLSDIIGRPFRDIINLAAQPGLVERAALARSRRRAIDFEILVKRRGGADVLQRVFASPILDAKGDLVHYVTVHEDITDARKRDNQLRESQKMEAVGQLTGGIAHDFNNLLTVIRGNAEDLRDELKDSPLLSRQADLMLRASVRGAELVSQLLSFARRQDLHPQIIDLNESVDQARSFLARTLQENIAIGVQTYASPLHVNVDPGLLESAILNMGLNARDAMPEGGKLLLETSRAEIDDAYVAENRDARPGSYAVFSISDSGFGMDEAVKARAFEPFFTTKEVGEGTGLGLSMVYGFVRQSAGHAKIYSEPGQGTTIKIFLPLAAVAPVGAADAADVAVREAATGTVMVVEDDDLVRESVVHRLKQLGYTVVALENAAAALDALDAGAAVDLVFSDVIMPGAMNGGQLAERIQDRWPKTKVLLTSGYTATAVLGRARIPPGVEVLSKPYANADLAAAIQRTLQR